MPERVDQHREAARQAQRKVQRVDTIENPEDVREERRVHGRAGHRDHTREAEQRRRQIQERQQPMPHRAADPAARPLGELQREMQEERRQQQNRHGVGPVKDPVEPIEPPVERERECPEERETEPEEVQRRFVTWTAIAHGGADDQREDADGREHVVERRVSTRQRGERDGASLTALQAQDRVRETLAVLAGVEDADDVVRLLDRTRLDREQDVARLHARVVAGTARRDFRGADAIGSRDPENAVFDFVPGRAQGDVREAQTEQRRDKRRRRQRPDPSGSLPPASSRRNVRLHLLETQTITSRPTCLFIASCVPVQRLTRATASLIESIICARRSKAALTPIQSAV